MADDHDPRADDERRLAALLIERFGPHARRRDGTTEPTPADDPPPPPEPERDGDP
jgi:hypothetical protein